MDAKKCESIGGKWNSKTERCKGFNIKHRRSLMERYPFSQRNPTLTIEDKIGDQLKHDFNNNITTAFISQRGMGKCKFITYKEEENKDHIAFAKDRGIDIEKAGPYRCKYNLRVCKLGLSGPEQSFGPIDIGHGTAVAKGWWMDDKNISIKEIEFVATDIKKPKPKIRLPKTPVDIGLKNTPEYPIFAGYNVPVSLP